MTVFKKVNQVITVILTKVRISGRQKSGNIGETS